jgi:hypothetical protein
MDLRRLELAPDLTRQVAVALSNGQFVNFGGGGGGDSAASTASDDVMRVVQTLLAAQVITKSDNNGAAARPVQPPALPGDDRPNGPPQLPRKR